MLIRCPLFLFFVFLWSENTIVHASSSPPSTHTTAPLYVQAISDSEALDRRDALECVGRYKELLARVRDFREAAAAAAGGVAWVDSTTQPRGPPKKKPQLVKKRELEEQAKAKKAAAEAKAMEQRRLANGGRLTAEELGFFIRSGPDANRRANSNMDIQIANVQLYGGVDRI